MDFGLGETTDRGTTRQKRPSEELFDNAKRKENSRDTEIELWRERRARLVKFMKSKTDLTLSQIKEFDWDLLEGSVVDWDWPVERLVTIIRKLLAELELSQAEVTREKEKAKSIHRDMNMFNMKLIEVTSQLAADMEARIGRVLADQGPTSRLAGNMGDLEEVRQFLKDLKTMK